MKHYMMALDQGTTSSRCILFDRSGRSAAWPRESSGRFSPSRDGWSMIPWTSGPLRSAWRRRRWEGSAPRRKNIAAIGITNQRETVIVWEKETGRPVCNAIVWQCRRDGAHD